MTHLLRLYSRAPGTPRTPRGAIQITRPTPWGNPFVVGRDGTQEKCVELYREWLNDPIRVVLRERMKRELAGKDLVCACAMPPCHGEVILAVANS